MLLTVSLYERCVLQGAENCLEGCVFVLTGVMESMEREDAKSLIERYGGKVTGNVSKKTTYLVQGRDSGVSKLDKVIDLSVFQEKLKHSDRDAFWGKRKIEWWRTGFFIDGSDFLFLFVPLLRLRVWAPWSWMKTACWNSSESNQERSQSMKLLQKQRSESKYQTSHVMS